MAMNYLQYISATQQRNDLLDYRFLVSGVDSRIRGVVGNDIVNSTFKRGKTLFIVDNTQSNADLRELGQYQLVNLLSGEISLCSELLDVSSLPGISRLRAFLSSLGFDNITSMKIISYLDFVSTTQKLLGESPTLTLDIIQEYSSSLLVEYKLKRLVDSGELSEMNYRYLLGKYAEISSSAADFEEFLLLISPFIYGGTPAPDTAVHIPFGQFAEDELMQKMLSKLLIAYLKQHANESAILILDDGNGERHFITDIIKNAPLQLEIHVLSDDVFTLEEADMAILLHKFPVRIYTRHESLASCGKIESICGEIEVCKQSKTRTVDKRWGTSSVWDMLLGNDYTESITVNTPVKQSLFKKEDINRLNIGIGIIDSGGQKALFSF